MVSIKLLKSKEPFPGGEWLFNIIDTDIPFSGRCLNKDT